MYPAGHGQDYQQQRHHSHPRDDDDGNGPPPSKRPRNSPQVTDGYGNNTNNNNAPAFVGGAGGGGGGGRPPPQDGHGRGSPVVAEGSSKMRSPVVPPRPQEKDKNRRLSCKECRRLKLKCDRVFPCQSCVKRGCGSLCPEGALTSGRGSRFILANTEQLHEKITQLSDRVRELEEALEHLQSTVSDQPHPLLSPEKLRVKTSQDLYGIAQPPLPPPHQLQQQPQPPPQSYPQQQQPVAGPSRLPPLPASSRDVSPVYTTDTTNPNPYPPVVYPAPPEVHPDVLQLSATFPFPWSVDLRIRKLIRDSLPARHEAQAICEQAQQNALWQYHLDASETFLQNLLHHCYSTPIEDLSPRRLALLLMLLSVGSIVDLTRPLGSLHGEAYHHLARASVCEIPLMEEPDFDELHALFFMIWWHLIFSDNKKAVGYAWNLMGFVAKLAQGLGLHRDSPRLKGIPEEYEKRRAIFWELLNLDTRMSLSLGRPPSMCLSHVDIKRPSFSGSGIYVPREEIIYHEWKNAFFIQCLTPVLEAIVVVDAPSYAQFLELDRLVRDFSVPALLDEHRREGEGGKRFLVMQRALVASSRDIALLQLHRRFFAEAMSSPEPFDLHHKYAPSVLATYLGAASLISTIETLFDYEPQLSARFLYFWFNSYSAAVTLSLFVFRAPLTPFAPNAYKELDRICRLFRNAAKILPVSGRILPLVEKLAAKAHACLLQHQTARSLSSAPGPSNELVHRQQPAPQPWSTDPHLPLSRKDVHPILLRYAEELKSSAASLSDLPPSPLLSSSYPSSSRATPTPTPSTTANTTSDSWLPDIYRYSSAGISLDAMYASSAASPAPSAGSASSSGLGQAQGRQRTPFTPSSPRVDGKEEFNLDHGSLAGEFGETSYMAWF